jgi:hypothetical protein
MSLSRGCYFNNTVTTHCTNIDSSGERHCDLICDTHLCNGATSIDTNPPIDTSNPNVAPSTHLAPVALLLVIATILLIVSL